MLMAFDTGPGNALVDDWVRHHTGQPFDEDGRLAAGGTIDEDALLELMTNAYFGRVPPKSLDRNAFSLDPVRHLAPPTARPRSPHSPPPASPRRARISQSSPRSGSSPVVAAATRR